MKNQATEDSIWYEYSEYTKDSYKSTIRIQSIQLIKIWAKMAKTLHKGRYMVANMPMKRCPVQFNQQGTQFKPQ